MFNPSLSDEQKALRQLARQFARNEIAPVAAEADRIEEYPWELVEKAHAIGLINITVPEEYGGGGLGYFDDCLVAEEISAACAGVYSSFVASTLGLTPLNLAATPDQMERLMRPFCAEPALAAFCLTEPGAGSDVASVRTRASRDGDSYILDGTKRFITNGGVAKLYTVTATLDPELRHEGLVLLVVPSDSPGVSTGKKEEKMGQRAADTREVIFEDVRVPVENRLGEEGHGFQLVMETLDRIRAEVAAAAVGVGRAAMEAALRYAKEREQFSRPIASFQAIQFKLANMAIKLEAARLLVWQAAWLADQGSRNSYESAIAKCFAADSAMEITTDAVQVFGGYGYVREYPVEKYMRDAKLLQIYEGTSEIQRLVISRWLLRE
ncbi:MAG: acyl-CoA dehydrogenase family protein [Anaerolineae bacterium]|jgi:acyl-CoA dehydrogenase